VGLAAAGESSFALAWAALAMALARGLTAQALRPVLPWPMRIDGLRTVVDFGMRSSVLYLTGALGTRTPDLIVGKALGTFAVGLYSRAASLSDQFRLLISGAIGSVFYPAFARLRDRGEPLGPAYLRVCAGYSAVVWPGMAALALAAEPVTRLLFGEAWVGAAPALAMIALAEIMLIALPLVSDLPILLGKLSRLLAFNIADTALSIALLIAGCRWGVEGAAASRLVYAFAWLLLYWRFMHGLVRFDARALARLYGKSALVTLAAIAPLGLTYLVVAGPAAIGFATLSAAASAGAITWGVAMLAVRHPARDDLVQLVATLPFARGLGRSAVAGP
jgi:O-antigen/teichoic acid export membrane protein